MFPNSTLITLIALVKLRTSLEEDFQLEKRFSFHLVVIWAASRSEQRDATRNIHLQAAQETSEKS